MKRILKYKLPVDGNMITINAHVIKWLDIKTQDGWPHIWAIVDDEAYPSDYEIVAWGTGWEYPSELNTCKYMGTAIDAAGYVWHYFMQPVVYATGTTVIDETPSLLLTTNCPLEIEPYSVTISTDNNGYWSTTESAYTEALNTLSEVVKYLESSCNTASVSAYM